MRRRRHRHSGQRRSAATKTPLQRANQLTIIDEHTRECPQCCVYLAMGTAKPFPRPGERQATTEEFRILTCRHTPDSLSFHLGPPLLLGHTARKSRPGKLLPFPKSPNGSLKHND